MRNRGKKKRRYADRVDREAEEEDGDSLIEDYGESEVPDETITEIVKRHEENN